ncbi:hypothetical protein [Cupriavidus sp. UYPR2.512]|uniref:hypothetical protein n=1 Tax=Cupriavidus sp. UYPR2.512 TaxID=1080187 RepID=UPI0012F956A6|nr:hypothetical protein [Cupriavidus sp. UYPR2.512]UIF87238.1 hypothetical protein KAF44_06720 [Cupriavidus necator]
MRGRPWDCDAVSCDWNDARPQALRVTGSYFVVGLGLLCGVNTMQGRGCLAC